MTADAGTSIIARPNRHSGDCSRATGRNTRKEPRRHPEDVPFSDIGADSLALIELVEALEENLSAYVAGFHIDDEDLEGLLSVRDAVDYVAVKLQGS